MRKLALALVALLIASVASPAQAVTSAPAPSTIAVDSPLLVAGAYVPGGTLRAIYPKENLSLSASFQWIASGVEISGATSESIVLTNEQLGKKISVRLTLAKAGSSNKIVTLTGLTVANAPLPTSNGSMTYYGENMISPGCISPHAGADSGTPTVDWKIWMPCDPWNNSFGGPLTSEYVWYRNGVPISTSISNTYKLTSADAGQSIWGSFKATWSNGYVFTETKKLVDAIPALLKTATPVISGSVKVGSKLTVKTTGWDSSATLSYQWFRDFYPIIDATTSTYTLTSNDMGKAIQVMVSGQRSGFTSASALSASVGNASNSPDVSSAYKKVNQELPTVLSNFDINYLSSVTVANDSLAREQALVKRAANFWAANYTPNQVTVVYLTKDDSVWAESVVSQHSGWSNHIPNGITWWINTYSCGFALAFKDDQDKQVFIQCIKNGVDSTLADRQVGPHEYTHWVQYDQASNLFFSAVPWLVEGQANFYGLALGVAAVEPNLKTVNISLAQQATQFDIYNGYKFADFKLLSLLKSANTNTNAILLRRSGTVWDQYLIGSLMSEWLVLNFGTAKYTSWMKSYFHSTWSTFDEQVLVNARLFRVTFGFDYDKLPLYAAPYLAARSDQLKTAWSSKK